MKYLQFIMVGGEDYVNQCLDDELIQENLVRNIKGAAQIGGRVQITLSDKASKDALQEKLLELGVSKEELKSLQVIEEKKLLKSCKEFFKRDPELASRYDVIVNSKHDPRKRFVYYDMMKLLSINNAPAGQIVELADLDQQVDIRQNPNFTIENEVGLYTSMHLGEHPNDHAYRRHDMNKGELIKYFKDNSHNISNRPYTNERSYLVGRGNDERIMKILSFYAKNVPHFIVNDYLSSLPGYEINNIVRSGVSDAKMTPELRETLIKRAHIDFNQTSLLPRERAQGKEVGFEHLEKEKSSEKKKDKAVIKPNPSQDFGGADEYRAPFFVAQEDPNIELSGITPPDNKNDNSSSIPSGTIATLTVAALATGYFLRRFFGGGNAKKSLVGGTKNSGRKGR